mmetsp:Transcript_60/g.218  ORF Transcript_60/g.218 Transcript_60/m.218 type:complete len:467 (+) Transcript_60:146-1546(+)
MEEEKARYLEQKLTAFLEGLTESLLKELPDNPVQHAHSYCAHLLENEKQAGRSSGSKSRSIMAVPPAYLKAFFDSAKAINSHIRPQDTIKAIIRETCSLLRCERATLFTFDGRLNALLVLQSVGKQSSLIRVVPGEGIAGTVFKEGEPLRIPDAYEDPRFDQSHDKETDFKTKSILAVPVMEYSATEGDAKTIGVLQAINKLGGEGEDQAFTSLDELLLENLAQYAGIAVRNAEMYRVVEQRELQSRALLEVINSLKPDLGTQSVIISITTCAKRLVNAQRSSVYLLDQPNDALWTVATDTGQEIRIGREQGLAGACAKCGEIVNVPDAYEDERFDQSIDKSGGDRFRTKSVLCLPIKDERGAVLGVIQMINREEEGILGAFHWLSENNKTIGVFDEEDVNLMETFCSFVGQRLQHSELTAPCGQGTPKLREAEKAWLEPKPVKHAKDRRSSLHDTVIEEAPEEEG